MATIQQPFPDFGELLTYAEAVKSRTAISKGIANIPNAAQYANMVRVYKDFYLPICAQFGKLPISSFFRSPALNKAIGGSKSSAHMAGCAVDIDCDGIRHVSNRELFEWIRKTLRFDQLIAEAPDVNNNPSWIHIAHNRYGQADRNEVMVMKRVNGETIYEYI